MIPAQFDYQAPATLEEAVSLLSSDLDGAKILADRLCTQQRFGHGSLATAYRQPLTIDRSAPPLPSPRRLVPGKTIRPERSPGQCASTAWAMAAEALPAPITTVRPRGGVGRNGGTQRSGNAAATAASKRDRRRVRWSCTARPSLVDLYRCILREVRGLRGCRREARHRRRR